MKKNNVAFEEYLKIVSDFFDTSPEVLNIYDSDIKIIAFHNELEKGQTVFFSFGISSSIHPEWIDSKPEMIVYVNSLDNAWGIVMGEIIKQARTECRFAYTDLYHWGKPISKESNMNSYFVFANSIIEEKDAYIQLSDRKIHFSEMYPIYEEEREIICQIGPIKFFFLEDWDHFDVKRKMLDINKYTLDK